MSTIPPVSPPDVVKDSLPATATSGTNASTPVSPSSRPNKGKGIAGAIVEAVVSACEPQGVPVTLKMRTGWCHDQRNAPVLALAAQDAGVQMLTIHGRTRDHRHTPLQGHLRQKGQGVGCIHQKKMPRFFCVTTA